METLEEMRWVFLDVIFHLNHQRLSDAATPAELRALGDRMLVKARASVDGCNKVLRWARLDDRGNSTVKQTRNAGQPA